MDGDKAKEDMFSSSNVNLMELFPKLLNVDKDKFKMTPSEFIKEMSLNLEERHKQLVNNSQKRNRIFNDYPPQFRVIPTVVLFQRYDALSANYLSLEIKNVGKASVGLIMQCPSSIYFSATFASRPLTKLAPGLSVEYKISFTPQEPRDYSHQLMFTSNEHTFQVPVIAIGPRPMLDIPDQIVLSPAPVKISTNKFIVVRNIGDATAVFNFSTGSKHFQVSPTKGILAVRDSVLLKITFESKAVNEVTDTLYLFFETGEKLSILLHGSAENISVRLDKNSVVHEDTYIGLNRCKTVRLINNSSSVVKYSWKKNKTLEEDLRIIKSMREKYKEISELEVLKDAEVTYFGLSNHENHKLSCERILKDELKLLEKEEFAFPSDIFTLMPQSGEVWPKDSREIIISFGPKTCGPAQAEAYLEVSGREARLPLKIKGNGLGPNISTNIKVLDVDYIYLCSHHQYELLAENKGDIPGTLVYVPEPSVFGGKVEVNPKSRHLLPDEMAVFIISFTSNRPGDFTEKLNFIIKESEEKRSVIMKGKIVSPTLHFDNKEINFGAVPFGISVTRQATLNNLSVVPVTFSLRVSPDGILPGVSYEEFAKFTTKPTIPVHPKEFEVYPEESVVEPHSSKEVTVTVTANKVGSFRKQLVVDMWDSENGSVSCPIFYKVEIANLVGDPEMIIIPFCFINYPYTRSITLRNLSHVAGLFYIVPLNQNSDKPVTYSANMVQGVIPPHRSVKIEVTVIITAVGRQVFPVSLLTFGSDLPQEICNISCLGQGPIISVEPMSLHWGQVHLLDMTEKTLKVTNVSPIPATVELHLVKSSPYWKVSPASFTIRPEEVTVVTASLLLNECGKFKDILKINIYNGKEISIPLTAAGVGSSLLMTPSISPIYDLGVLFCHRKYEFRVSIENKGTKAYGLLWSPYVEYKTFVNAKFSLPEDSVFRLEPIKMDILPGEVKYITVEAHSKIMGSFTQTFYCFANSGSPTKNLHYVTEVCAKFVGPMINFDKEEINFWYYAGADGIEEKLHDTLAVKNMSVLPVQLQISATQPFCLLTQSGTYLSVLKLSLEGHEKKDLDLKFMAPQSIRKYYKVYNGKLVVSMNDTSKTSSVVLKGEVSYPNITVKPTKADFHYVKVGTNDCIEIKLLNTSPLTVYYDLKWKKQMCQVTSSVKQRSETHDSKPTEGTAEAEDTTVLKETLEEKQEGASLVHTPTPTSILVPPVKPVFKMPEINVSNSDIKAVLFNLTRAYFNRDYDLLNVYKMVRSEEEDEDGIVAMCNKYCVITPFYGKLEPFCSQTLYVGFCSNTPVRVHLEAVLQIRAGPTETLVIDAISGDIDYRLSATELDFGKQLFCETQSQILKIKNTSEMPFTFETYTGKDGCEEFEQFSLGQGVVTVSPRTGSLNSFQTADLVVRYHPGVPGKFETYLRIRIGHLNSVVVKVRGIGVFPQVYVFLPRPEIFKIPEEIGYHAVATLTPDWILTDFPIGNCIYDVNQLKPYRSRENSSLNFTDIDKAGDEWDVIKNQEFTPSEIDIFLAIERILAYNLIAEDVNNTSFAVYARTIPRFIVPAYDLDFGVCVIGRIVEKQVSVMNFGPLPVILYGIFSQNLKEEGFHVRLKNRNELKVDSCLTFTVAFNAKKIKYKKKYELVKSGFYFEIYHGPKIPIKISAEVTYPHVQPSMFLINFREVICGQCKIINLRLKNPGLVKARWNLVLKNDTVHVGTACDSSKSRPMFSVDCSSGILNPEEYCTVQVSFKPAFGSSFSTSIVVQVAKSLDTLKIQLLGVGIEPKLQITNSEMTFSSALPFPVKGEEIFSVENPSPFSIEFYFPEFDEQANEEKRIIRALARYYQTEEILLPVRRPGDSLPSEIVEFYYSLLESLNIKFMEEERQKILAEKEIAEENLLGAAVDEDPQSILSEQPSMISQDIEAGSKKRRSKKLSRSGTSVDTSRDLLVGCPSEKEPIIPTLFEAKTQDEIEDMLDDFIVNNLNHNTSDPVQAALKSVLPPEVAEEQEEGTLIICHGAPYTNWPMLSNRLAITINKIALNIDRIVLTEAALGRCEAGATARELIEQAYSEHVDGEKKGNAFSMEWEESPAGSSELSFEGYLEEIQRKFQALIDLRESVTRGTREPTTAKSETSRKLDRGATPVKSQVTYNLTLPILTEELILEILKYRLQLEMRNGLVIEGLESSLIISPIKVLTLLLKAAGNIKEIIVVFFLSDYNHFMENLTIKNSEKELAQNYFREEILNVLEEEPEEAFKTLSLDEAVESALRQVFLGKRYEAYDLFLKKRDKFYKKELPKESVKQVQEEVASPPFHMKHTPQSIPSNKKGRDSGKRKDVTEVPETINKDEGDGKSGKTPKRGPIESEYATFETDFAEMKAIIENWDQRIGAVILESTSDVKPKKGQSARKIEPVVSSQLDDSKRGLFLWLVDVSGPQSSSFLACCNYLKEVLESRHRYAESDGWPQTSDEGMTFAVITAQPKTEREPSQHVFFLSAISQSQIIAEETETIPSPAQSFPSNIKLNSSPSSTSFKDRRKQTVSSRRGKPDSRISSDVRSFKKASFPIVQEPLEKSRWVLEPGAKQNFKVKYYPTDMGLWKHKYAIEMVNWTRQYAIQCSGVCDIPRINMKPEVLFPAVEHFKPLTSRFYPAFYFSLNAYDFGSIITQQTGDTKKTFEKTATLNLCNISTLPAEISILLADDEDLEETKDFDCLRFEPPTLWIEPGKRQELLVTACPNRYGPVKKALMLIVKNNPLVEKITVLFEGVKANVSVSPKVVNFERQLLQRKELRNIVFTNDNTIELFAVLNLPENFPPQFAFSHKNVWLPPLGSFTIEVIYTSTEVQIVHDKPVPVEVFDNPNAVYPVQELNFLLNAEAYDAALDIIFSKAEEDHIEFGDIRVENYYPIEFYLKNVGKYQLGYKIDIENNILSGSVNDVFQVTPQLGKLQPGKIFPVTVTVMFQNEVSWHRTPFLKITLVEPFYGDEVIATIPIAASIRTHFARYEIKPESHLSFGHIEVGSAATGSILIENKGLFSLAYFLDVQSSNQVDDSLESSKKSSKLSAADKTDKMKKSGISLFKAGIFEISPGSGTVDPKQTALLKVIASPQEVKRHEENIVIYIHESLPHLKNGNPMTISADACLPKIRFQDYKTIFREHYVCKDEAELKSRIKHGTHTVYAENSNLFSFKNVCVNTAAEARIHLENAGLVDCKVTAVVKPAPEEDGLRKSFSEGGFQNFTLSPEKIIIEAYNSACLLLTFRPEALEVYRAVIEISVQMPEGYKDEVGMFKLWGQGIFPQIEITEPITKLPEGHVLVNFPPTSPGRITSSSIAFSNTGLLDCKVIIEIYKFQNGVFTLRPKSGTERMLKIWDISKPIDHTVVLSLSPGQVAEFCAFFKPEEVQSYTSEVKLFVVDNPFENWCYKLVGEVFLEEVVIEKIRTTMPFLADEGDDDKPSLALAPGQYFVNLGDCYVKKRTSVLMRLSNKTGMDYFKFEWDEIPSFTLSPKVGHLYPNTYKEILLEFKPQEPVEFEDVTLTCKLSKIQLEKPSDVSWDSRRTQNQKQLKHDAPILTARSTEKAPTADSRNAMNEEPGHEVVPESNSSLFLTLSGVADYTKLICQTSKIFFKSTFMFQTRIYPLVLENPGNVVLDYKLSLKAVTVWPLKRSKPEEQSVLKGASKKCRPKSSNNLVATEQCKKPSLNRPYAKIRRPKTSASRRQPLDDCEQEPVQSAGPADKPYFNPFTMENSVGRIPPKGTASCNIIFSPMDMNQYKAVITIQSDFCSVEHLHPECVLPEIEVMASSFMPYCHFDVAESDYLESGRRDFSRPGPVGYAPGVPLHPDTKPIEVKAVGVGATIPIKFHVINPTEEDYSFSWVNITQVQQGVAPSFHCSTLGGYIRAGRQQLMVFSFKSQKVGITESFWKFSIPEYGIEAPFLLVGDTREPAAYFLSNHISLKPTLIGTTSTDTLAFVNNEEVPLEFQFLKESLFSEGRMNALRVEPLSGKAPPNSEICIRVTFIGRHSGKTVFNLKCKVKGIKEPLGISVEAMTYLVQPVLAFEDLNSVKHFPDLNKQNVIDFGSELSLNIPETVTMNFTSLSKPSFTYEWEYDSKVLDTRHCKLSFSPNSGHVASKGKCDISLIFKKKSCLTNFPVYLKIQKGPTYNFVINGSASTVLCDLSFSCYDFGFCFLQESDVFYNETSLIITNKNGTELFLECYLPGACVFSYSLPASSIPPWGQITIPIGFRPKESISYSTELKFTFNGNYTRTVRLKGHGADCKVVLVDPDDLTISLGAVRLGRSSTRQFSLKNESQAIATLLVGFCDQLPVNRLHFINPEKNHVDLSQDHRLTGLLTISPSTVFKIKPQESFTLSVTYTPQERTPSFSETVCIQNGEKTEPLCVLTGCCLAPEISLDRKALNFGAVIQSCTSTLKLKLMNSGSIGASFEWIVTGSQEFVISPSYGYCSPESDVTINVTFRPCKIQNCIKNTIECKLYLADNENYPSLWLELIGDCVTLPEPKEIMTFECTVRDTVVKELQMENPGGSEWQLVPVISGEYFKGEDALIVPALSSVKYLVEYSPLTMTEENFHKGSVFFKLPSGQGILYELKGFSLPPPPIQTITREVPCKTKYVELLKIKNWLQYSQRFKVKITCLESKEDPAFKCTGLEYLEVPAMVQREYSLNFFAYNTGNFVFNVHFVNEETQEYAWYNVSFKVNPCGPLETITLRSGVRQLCTYELQLENPLNKTVKYELKTTSPEVHFDSNFYEVPPEETVIATLSFIPIHPRDIVESLTAQCPELGTFPRELRLLSSEMVPGPPRTFEAPLGSFDKQKFPVENLASVTAVMNCKVDSAAFIVSEYATAMAGETKNIIVTYEPLEIGSTAATLTVHSEQAGNFIFPLQGLCLKPLARGPFTLKSGSGVNIPFKNVFLTAKEFHMSVDNPAFVLKSPQETLSPKEEYKIYVSLQKLKALESENDGTEINPKYPIMGQLLVETLSPYVKWQFYLKGVLDK